MNKCPFNKFMLCAILRIFKFVIEISLYYKKLYILNNNCYNKFSNCNNEHTIFFINNKNNYYNSQ